MAENTGGREVIFEFTPVGNIMRVIAVDTETMTEVSIQGPINAGEATLQRTALAKLEYVLRKAGKIS